MNSGYSEQDTARVRRAEQSSAGIETQQLQPWQPSAAPPAPPEPRVWLGLGLVVLGVLAVLGRVGGLIDPLPGIILLTIASGLLFFSFWQRIYGLLIPGCLLVGLSIGVPLADLTNGAAVLWGLALGFLSILMIGRAWFGMRSNWPIFPAVPLFLVGVIAGATALPGVFSLGLAWMPLALIALGLFLGWPRRQNG